MRWLPNAITIARLVLVAPLVLAILDHAYVLALAFMMTASLSDFLDGMLARRLQAESALGALLDSLADKLLMLASLLSLGWVGLAPWWFVALVLTRDLIVVGGGLAYRLLVGPYKIEPLRTGKQAIASQMVTLVLMLAAPYGAFWRILMHFFLILAMTLTLLSGYLYVRVWLSRYREEVC